MRAPARERGNTGLATSLREEARAIVRSVADSLSDKRLRATFLTGSEVADLLRGDYKQSEYGRVILPFTVLRRMDCVLEKTKEAVLAENEAR